MRRELWIGVAALAPAMFAQNGGGATGAKGAAKPGVHYTVELVRDGNRQPVSLNFPFKTGDRVSLVVRSDFDAYIYVLNRTLSGDPEAMATRSMSLIADVDAHDPPKDCPYDLVFPAAGQQYRLKAGVSQNVPPRGQTMLMNDPPGVEKLLLIVSPSAEADVMANYARIHGCVQRTAGNGGSGGNVGGGGNPGGGNARGGSASGGTGDAGAANGGGGAASDTDNDVLNRFNRRVLEMEQNVEEKGFDVVEHPHQQDNSQQKQSQNQNPPGASGGTATPKTPSKPIAVEISLKHRSA